MELTPAARLLLERRYLLPGESPEGLFWRAASAVGGTERSREFFSLLSDLLFLPNSPTLMNAGTPGGQLSACFVLPVEDSIEGIFTTLTHMALIHQSGGGTGFSFSRLRPRGDIVNGVRGAATGPVSFMRVFDAAKRLGIKNLDAYIIEIRDNIELGMERTARALNLNSLDDIKVLDYARHPLVALTHRQVGHG